MVVGDTVHQRPCSLKILVTRTTNNFMQLLEIATGDLVIVFATYYSLKKILQDTTVCLGIFWNFRKDEVDLKQEDNVTTFEADNQFKIMTGILAS